MRTRTLQSLISDVRQRANMESSQFVTDTEITEYINQALAELWGHICQNGGQPFYRSLTTFPVVAGTSFYPLPADFMALEGLEGAINGWVGRIDPFMQSEHAQMSNTGFAGIWYNSPVRYRLAGSQIEILPAINNFTATLYYVPTCPRLVNLSDTFDGFDGYEVAAIYQAVATINAKEETDPSFYQGERDRVYRHIDSLISARDMSATERVSDVRSGGAFGWPWFGGSGGY